MMIITRPDGIWCEVRRDGGEVWLMVGDPTKGGLGVRLSEYEIEQLVISLEDASSAVYG